MNQTRITNAVLSCIVKTISANFVILHIVVLAMLLPQANAKTMTLNVELIRVGRPFGVTRNMRTFWRAALFTAASVVSAFDCHTTLWFFMYVYIILCCEYVCTALCCVHVYTTEKPIYISSSNVNRAS